MWITYVENPAFTVYNSLTTFAPLHSHLTRQSCLFTFLHSSKHPLRIVFPRVFVILNTRTIPGLVGRKTTGFPLLRMPTITTTI